MKLRKVVIVAILFMLPVFFVLSEAVSAVRKLNQGSIEVYTAGSLGEPTPLTVGKIQPALVLDAKLLPLSTVSQRIHTCKDPVLLVNLGTEVSKGESVVECKNSIIQAGYNGVIKDLVREEELIILYDTYEAFKLEVSADQKNKELYKRDLENDNIKLKFLKQDLSLNHEGKITTVYQVVDTKGNDYYPNESVVLYFFEEEVLENQILVNKTAVYYKDKQSYLRIVEENGLLIGDVPVEILEEDQGQYAIKFVDGQNYTHFDLEYGIFQNRMQNENVDE